MNDNILIFKVQSTSNNDLESVRKLRNTVLRNMTGNQQPTSREEQRSWFEEFSSKDSNSLYVMYESFGVAFVFIGYGLVYEKDGKIVVSGAIESDYRGKGIGTKLFNHLTNEAHKITDCVYLEVFDWNLPAKKVYHNLGYMFYDKKGEVVYMKNCKE